MSERVACAVQPWLLLGERRRRALEHRIRAAAERWAEDWVAGEVTVSVAVDPVQKSTTRNAEGRKTQRFAVRGKSGDWLAELVIPHRLIGWAAGLGVVELSAIAEFEDRSPFGEIEAEMMRRFWDVLVAQGQVQQQGTTVDVSLECLEEQSADEMLPAFAKRSVRVVCQFGSSPGFCLQAILSPTAIATLLAEGRPRSGGEKLKSRRSALGPTTVCLESCLGSVQVPVRELHSLRIGDVLLTDITLDGQVELRVRSKLRPIAAGTLGEVGGRKAIKVETSGVSTVNQGLQA